MSKVVWSWEPKFLSLRNIRNRLGKLGWNRICVLLLTSLHLLGLFWKLLENEEAKKDHVCTEELWYEIGKEWGAWWWSCIFQKSLIRTTCDWFESLLSTRNTPEDKWIIQFSSVQLLSHVWLFATPWTAACQAFLSITNSQSLFKL